MKKKEILDKLIEWKKDTDSDIKSKWISETQKQDFIRQSLQLATIIGLLSTIGYNNNIG